MIIKNILNRFRILTYNIGFIKKDINKLFESGIEENDIFWLKHNYKDRFFADPFLWKIDADYFYILVEEYLFKEEKGKITLLTVDKTTFTLVKKDIIIEEDFHLSFPFCNLNDNNILVESIESSKTFSYDIDLSTNKILKRNLVSKIPLVDPVRFIDRNNREWIFSGKIESPKDQLYVYYKNESNYNPIQESPIKNDIKSSRSAGRIFKKGEFYFRPTQDCEIRYGHQIRLMQMDKLTTNNYEEHEVLVLNNSKCKFFNETMHTFNVYNEIIIVDGSKDILRFPMKLYYKVLKKYFKK